MSIFGLGNPRIVLSGCSLFNYTHALFHIIAIGIQITSQLEVHVYTSKRAMSTAISVSMKLGPEKCVPIREVSSFRRVLGSWDPICPYPY